MLWSFVTTNKGQQKLWYQCYLFIRQKGLANGAVGWECERSVGKGVQLELNPVGANVRKSQLNEHTHGPDPTHKDVIQVTSSSIKRIAIKTAPQIISTAVCNVSESTAAQLPPTVQVETWYYITLRDIWSDMYNVVWYR